MQLVRASYHCESKTLFHKGSADGQYIHLDEEEENDEEEEEEGGEEEEEGEEEE